MRKGNRHVYMTRVSPCLQLRADHLWSEEGPVYIHTYIYSSCASQYATAETTAGLSKQLHSEEICTTLSTWGQNKSIQERLAWPVAEHPRQCMRLPGVDEQWHSLEAHCYRRAGSARDIIKIASSTTYHIA